MNVGDKVKIVRARFVPKLNGLEGFIYKTSQYAGQTFYHIRATNEDLRVVGEKESKTVSKWWKVGNHTAKTAEEIVAI